MSDGLETHANRVKTRLLKNARKCLIEMTRDAACRSIEGLERVEAWEQLSKFCWEAGKELVFLANSFLQPSLRPNWVAAKLKLYEAGILEANEEDLCRILSIREDRQIGEDLTRRILEDKLHEAVDKADVRAAASLAVMRSDSESSTGPRGRSIELEPFSSSLVDL